MKKLFAIIICFAAMWQLTACAVAGASHPSGAAVAHTDMEEVSLMPMLETLVEQNKRCVFEIFVLGCLPCDALEEDGDPILRVRSAEFPAFSDLERYVRSVYCAAEADRLLYGGDGDPMYTEVDGNLCIDIRQLAGQGYYVDWENYKLEILEQGADACRFAVVTSEEDVLAGTVSEKRLPMGAVLENGEWRLEKLVY